MKGIVILMRVLFCKIHFPCFICSCKSSTATNLYTCDPLKLENSPPSPPNLPCQLQEVASASCNGETIVVKDENLLEKTDVGFGNGETIELRNESSEDVSGGESIEVKNECFENDVAIKSCIKKGAEPRGHEDVRKKRVQWVDNLGKQLVQIKEFESSETGDSDNGEDNRGCICAIL